MYLFKLIFNKGNEKEIIYIYNQWSVEDSRFNEICNDVIEKTKVNNEFNLNEFLNRMDWEYGFKVTKVEYEHTINLI